MLQHNAAEATAPETGPNARTHAHAAHALMVGLHALCCGLPIVALMLTAASGAAFGTAAFYTLSSEVHAVLHAHEAWILAGSITLVSLGAVLEWRARKSAGPHGFPWMFAVSVFCLAANIAILVVHRAA